MKNGESYAGRSPKIPDKGTKFHKWTFVRPGESGYRWLCVCACGTEREVVAQDLRSGRSKSCGCSRNKSSGSEVTGRKNKTHGIGYENKVYRTWRNAKNRCYNPNAEKFPRWGKLGVHMHQAWVDSFEEFYAYIGDAPSPRHTLDRIDPDGSYVPGNIRWATAKEQANNTRMHKKVEMFGETRSRFEWCKKLCVSARKVNKLLQEGYSFEEAIDKLINKEPKK